MFITTVQALLGFIFLMAGAMKTFMQEKAFQKMPVLTKYPKSFITFIGFAEIAGALGITLPVWLNLYPELTVYAAGGLSVVMIGALHAHLKRKEFPQMMMAAIFLVGLVYVGGFFLN